jgi:hypothetical protein
MSNNLCAYGEGGYYLAVAAGPHVTVCSLDGDHGLWGEDFGAEVVGVLVQDEDLVVLTADGRLERRSIDWGKAKGTTNLGLPALALSGDDELIAVVGGDQALLLMGGDVVWKVEIPGVHAVALSEKAVLVAAGARLVFLDPADGAVKGELEAPAPVRALAAAPFDDTDPFGPLAVTAGDQVLLARVEPLSIKRLTGGEGLTPDYVAFSNCGSWLALTLTPGVIQLLDRKDLKGGVQLSYPDRLVAGLAVASGYLMVGLDQGDGNWLELKPQGQLSRTDPLPGGERRRWAVMVDTKDEILARHADPGEDTEETAEGSPTPPPSPAAAPQTKEEAPSFLMIAGVLAVTHMALGFCTVGMSLLGLL